MIIFILTVLFGVAALVTYLFYTLYSNYLSKTEAILVSLAIGVTWFVLPLHMTYYERFRGRHLPLFMLHKKEGNYENRKS